MAAKLSDVDETPSSGPRLLPTVDDLSLLDGLPYLALNLVKAPEALLRTLFEVVQLHDRGEHATLTITLPADQMNPQATPGQGAEAACVIARVPPVRFELTLDGF